MAKSWDEREYRVLFETCPLSGAPPSGAKLAALTIRLAHSRSGIAAQWDDARMYCRGNGTVASQGLKAYLDRAGLCRAAY